MPEELDAWAVVYVTCIVIAAMFITILIPYTANNSTAESTTLHEVETMDRALSYA